MVICKVSSQNKQLSPFMNVFLVDPESILFLLKFSTQDLWDNHAVTRHVLSTMQRVVRNSHALKHKIKKYFDGLIINTENMGNVLIALCSTLNFGILRGTDIYTVSYKLIIECTSSKHKMDRLRHFLANGQLWEGGNWNECNMLLECWTNWFTQNCMADRNLLMLTDELLDIYHIMSNGDWSSVNFIRGIIKRCFNHGKFSI